MVLEKTNGVIKPFAEAPDDLSRATVDNWSLGSLQYLFAQGLPLSATGLTIAEMNVTLATEEAAVAVSGH